MFVALPIDRPRHDRPNGQAARPIRPRILAKRLAPLDIEPLTVRPEMDGMTFRVTMVRPGPAPSFEIAAYEYVGARLPAVGETIVMRKVLGGEETRGYVTRVNPFADTPIAVTEVASELSAGDYLVA